MNIICGHSLYTSSVFWERVDGMPIPYDMYDEGNGLLIFRDAHPSHEGDYICQTEPLTDVSTVVTLTLGELTTEPPPTTPEPTTTTPEPTKVNIKLSRIDLLYECTLPLLS